MIFQFFQFFLYNICFLREYCVQRQYATIPMVGDTEWEEYYSTFTYICLKEIYKHFLFLCILLLSILV
jgi:hypothetical protein